jgi:hypothetical protein
MSSLAFWFDVISEKSFYCGIKTSRRIYLFYPEVLLFDYPKFINGYRIL